MNIFINTVCFFFLCCFFIPVTGNGQLPVCSTDGPVYSLGSGINGFKIIISDPLKPVIQGVNPVINTIQLLPGAAGLVAGPNLNSAFPATTFYMVESGRYFYYNGVEWIDTGHSAGSEYAINPTAGDKYIFNLDILTGNVWRYDGTADATLIANISASGCVFDLAADCNGNFYLLKTSLPQKITKYNASGVLINTLTVTGVPPVGYGTGLAVMGKDMYYFDTASYHGIINGNNVDFVMINNFFSGCSDMASCPGVLVRSATDNVHICAGSLPYNWSGQNYTAPGLYSVTFTGSNGCDSIASLNLAVTSVPTPAVVSQVNYCQYETALPLTATGAGSLYWYTVASGGSGTLQAPVPSTAVAGITDYFVSQQTGSCESPRVKISVHIQTAPKLGADTELHICNNTAADFSQLYNTNGFTASWTLNEASVTGINSVAMSGTYQLLAIAASGCSDTALVTLVIEPPLAVFAGNDSVVEANFPFHLGGAGNGNFEWSPAAPLNNPRLPDPLAVLANDATFYLQVKNAAGCQGFDTVNFKVLKGPAIYLPNTFTPNGDGVNDIFHITSVGMSTLYYFRVYNRFGQLVFQTTDPAKGWDGSFKAARQATNNFIWILKAKDRTGKILQMKGNVLLLR